MCPPLLPPADSEEHGALAQALVLIKETISAVDSQVHDYERASRLRDIGSRLEPRSHGRWKDGRVFTREDLAEGFRTLLHEGTVSCRVANGRLKGGDLSNRPFWDLAMFFGDDIYGVKAWFLLQFF